MMSFVSYPFGSVGESEGGVGDTDDIVKVFFPLQRPSGFFFTLGAKKDFSQIFQVSSKVKLETDEQLTRFLTA